MTRIIRGSTARMRRKKTIKLARSFVGSHSKLYRTAKQQVMKSLYYSYFDRRKNKMFFRSLWIRRINAAAKRINMKYSQVMNLLKRTNNIMNRKTIAELIQIDKDNLAALVYPGIVLYPILYSDQNS